MVIKKFVANSLPEALTKVKKDFGDEAVILKTRFNNKGPAGANAKVVEVTAAIDNKAVKTNRFKTEPTTQEIIHGEKLNNRISKIKSGVKSTIKKAVGNDKRQSKTVAKSGNWLKTEDLKTPKLVETDDEAPFCNLEDRPLPSEILAEIKKETGEISRNLIHSIKDRNEIEPLLKSYEKSLSEIIQEISLIRRQNDETIFGQPKGVVLALIRMLVASHLPEDVAIESVKNISQSKLNSENIDAVWEYLSDRLSALLNPGEPIKMVDSGPTVIMLIGPTGSGKSSAAARLAFKYSLEENIAVSLVSTDTFRADSKEQLASLANVIGCSFATASSPDELTVLMKTYKDGLVIIDTSGVSTMQDMDELSTLIAASNPHDIHLVVPADISATDLHDLTQNNPIISVDKLLVTKSDQSRCRGGIIGAAAQLGLRFSFESSSRELPGQFSVFDPKVFVSAIKPVGSDSKAQLTE